MQTLSVKLKKPVPLTNVAALCSEIGNETKSRYGTSIVPYQELCSLAVTNFTGPLESVGNSRRFVEACEIIRKPREDGRGEYTALNTFYGSIPLEVEKAARAALLPGNAPEEWKNHLNKKGIDETTVYFVDQVGFINTLDDFWRRFGRDLLKTGQLDYPEYESKQEIYGAYPFGAPFDCISIYPHQEEFGYNQSNWYCKDFLEIVLQQKEKMRKHFEGVLGRKIEIKESIAQTMLNALEESG
jgi:hypothetical protein